MNKAPPNPIPQFLAYQIQVLQLSLVVPTGQMTNHT